MHTPGPWKVMNTNGCKQIGYKPGQKPSKQTRYRSIACTDGLCADDEENEKDLGNARLMAASPELLSALQAALEDECVDCGKAGGCPLWHEMARDAIRKAQVGS